MSTRYPLGTSDAELERLGFQHAVWRDQTRALLDRGRVGTGAHVADVGCGPGFVAFEIAERVGNDGSVLAIDEAERWTTHVAREAERRSLVNVRIATCRAEDLVLEPQSLDVVFARWVLSFIRDPGALVADLARALVPGGRLLVQDYNHEGISLFPRSGGFEAVVRATREMYARAGGDAWVAGRLPRLLAAAGMALTHLDAQVLCGGPESPAFRWADRFFPHFAPVMEAQGLLSAAERQRFEREWAERKADPRAVFFSPIVVSAIGTPTIGTGDG